MTDTPTNTRGAFRRNVAIAVGMALFMLCMIRPIVSERVSTPGYDILFRVSMESYPTWVSMGWLPLDFVLMVIACYIIMRFFGTPDNAGGYVMGCAKICIGFGAMMSVAITAVGGWYAGIESFVVGAILVAVLCVIMAIIYMVFIGTTTLYRRTVASLVDTKVVPWLSVKIEPLRRFFYPE